MLSSNPKDLTSCRKISFVHLAITLRGSGDQGQMLRQFRNRRIGVLELDTLILQSECSGSIYHSNFKVLEVKVLNVKKKVSEAKLRGGGGCPKV